MLSLENLKMLKELYLYKSFGYTYYKEEIRLDNLSQKFMPNSIEKLHDTISNCQLCSLSNNRKNVVIGQGNINSKLMFIGEAPNISEDMSGKAFLGKSGEMLVNIIEKVLGLKKDDVYVANIVKCKPPQNRAPTENEANLCKPYLLKQINLVNPSIIVALGEMSFQYLTGQFNTPMSKIRGEIFSFENAKLIATYHPTHLIRNESDKKIVHQDMLKVKGLL